MITLILAHTQLFQAAIVEAMPKIVPPEGQHLGDQTGDDHLVSLPSGVPSLQGCWSA